MENKFDINRMSAQIDTGSLDVIILYNTAPDDSFPADYSPVATVPVIDAQADEIDWDTSKAVYSQYAPSWMDEHEADILAAIPEVMAKADLAW
jgi:hypothetical protein